MWTVLVPGVEPLTEDDAIVRVINEARKGWSAKPGRSAWILRDDVVKLMRGART